MQAFGRDEVSTHLLSLVFALVTIPVVYGCGASLFGRRAAAYCAVLAAGLPFLTEYAQETRMYSLLLLLSVLVAWSFVRAFVRRERRYLPVFAGALAVSLYTHNWALFETLATLVTFAFVLWRSADRRALLLDGVIAFGAALVLYLPWVPTLLYQAQHTGAPWDLPPILWSLTQGLYFIVGGRAIAVALLLTACAGLFAMTPGRIDALRPAPAPAGFAGLAGGDDVAERTERTGLISLLILGFGTLLIAWLYAKTTPAWANRYLAVIIGPLLLFFGAGLARAARLGLVAMALICCFWVVDPVPSSLTSKSNIGAGATAVRALVGSNAVVLSTQPEEVPVISYYLPAVTHYVTPLGAVPDPRVMDWRNGLQRFRRGSDKRAVLLPTLAALTPGERVVLIVPVRLVTTPEWMRLMRRDTYTWTRYLHHDKHLRLLRSVSPHQYISGVPLRITVYVER